MMDSLENEAGKVWCSLIWGGMLYWILKRGMLEAKSHWCRREGAGERPGADWSRTFHSKEA